MSVFRLSTYRVNPSSAQDLCAPPIKEKRLSCFSTLDFKNDSEQCGGFMCVSYHKARVNIALCVLIRSCSRLSYPFIASGRMGYESLRADKRKTAKPFFDSRLLIRFRAVRDLQRAHRSRTMSSFFQKIFMHMLRNCTVADDLI